MTRITKSPFGCNYTVEELDRGTPKYKDVATIYYPGAKLSGGRDGVLIKVVPDKESTWIGCFEFGYSSTSALTEITACPNPDDICVISSGTGYVVSSSHPSQWQQPNAFPIVGSCPIVEQDLIVFCDFTKLVALGASGVKWTSPQLASDGLKIIGSEERRIRVLAWKASLNSEVELSVDLESGELVPRETR